MSLKKHAIPAAVATNMNFRITSWSGRAGELYGWSEKEAVGKNIDDLLGTQYPIGYSEAIGELLRVGKLELTLRHNDKSGRSFAVFGKWSLSDGPAGPRTVVMHTYAEAESEAEPQHEPNPKPKPKPEPEIPVVPQRKEDDITEMLDGVAEDVWAYDIPSDWEWHSSQWLGRAAVGDGTQSIVHPEDGETVHEAIRAAMGRGERTFRVRYRTLREGLEPDWMLTQGRIRYDASGKPERVTGVTLDISDLMAESESLRLTAEEGERRIQELSDKNRAMTEFFTNVTHEFKTPLSIMLVDLQLMEYRLRDATGDVKDKLGRSVAVMRQNALRLMRLIGNLLDVTKIEAGFMKPRLIAADIVAAASGITESVRTYAKNAGVELAFISDTPSRVMAIDSEKLERILLNLLSNAIKHTPGGGHIEVRLANTPENVRISVRDDGEGIPEDMRDIVFSRFRQAGQGLARYAGGSGIGLALTKALVELLQGRVWFDSNVGTGTEFFVELPALEASAQERLAEPEGLSTDRKVEMEFSDVKK